MPTNTWAWHPARSVDDTFEAITGLSQSTFFFLSRFDHFVACEFGFTWPDGAAFGAGDYQDHIPEAGAGMAIGDFGLTLEGLDPK